MVGPTARIRGSQRALKILITGATSQVGKPVVASLAPDNEVWGLARFQDPAAREAIEALGARTVAVDLADDDLAAVFGYLVE